MRKEYKLKDFFVALKVAQCQIKLLKVNTNWDRRETLLMTFKIDKMLPFYWSGANRGELSFKKFTELKEVFQYILPGLSKANLRRIMDEARLNDKKSKSKIYKRRYHYTPFEPKPGSLVEEDTGIDDYTKNNRLCLDRVRYMKKKDLRKKWEQWIDTMNEKYRPVIEYYLRKELLIHDMDYSSYSWEMYKDGDNRTGIKAEGWVTTHQPQYTTVRFSLKAKDLIQLRSEYKEICVHEVVPIIMPKSISAVSPPKGGICKKCKQYVELIESK